MAQAAVMKQPYTAPTREQSWVYFNGKVCQYQDVHLGLMTHALHYGTGVFEGIRAYWSAETSQLYAFRMAEHFKRMSDNAKILRMKLPVPIEQLCEITVELLRKNAWQEDVYVRPIVFKGDEVIGVRLHDLKDSFGIYTAAMGNYVELGGLRCMVSSWRRIDDNAAPARAKITGIYVNGALAKSEALENGYDEAIFLNQDGHVCEGSAENIFIVRDGAFITPPETENILEGITRETLIELVEKEMGKKVVQRRIDRSELYIAEEVFFCGTGAQVAPVVEIDRRMIGDGKTGPMTAQLQKLYLDICKGAAPKYSAWLTPIY